MNISLLLLPSYFLCYFYGPCILLFSFIVSLRLVNPAFAICTTKLLRYIDYESEFTPTSSAASQVNTIIDDSKATSHLEELFHHCSNLAGRSGRKALSDLIERILPLSGRFELINMLDNVFFSVAEMEGIKSNPSRFIS